ncbi:hypothetical protein PSV08DRAFT_410917 [Bipolaris maydis]|uniref:uncharacterized protein n=1 Tax=Cochliobolus heterostrophus TaxID=5016 RepID=UPI0024DD931A|nr:hypothetical protein J3E73DRAFT_433602 [Bipolaris maydis]KAJ6268984.1 hypothetical protein PSV08DRAFT_410917 [Bipolaris maydis]
MAPTKRKKVDVEHLRSLAQQEQEPTPLTKEEIKATMIPSSYKQYEYIMTLWSDIYISFLRLRLRNRSGHQNNRKHSPVMLLYKEAAMRSMCPVTHFLALALADGVFQDCANLQEIEAKELPAVLDDNILLYGCFNNMLKGIGQRDSYKERLSAYCFRRVYARARRLLMGYSNDEMAMYYISVKKAAVMVTLSDRTPKQEYASRRQSRSIAYRKQHEAFFKGERFDSPYTTAPPASTPRSKKPLRYPSRYLKALWKFEHEWKAISRLLYPGCDGVAEDADIFKPMVAMANLKKKRYRVPQEFHMPVCQLRFTKVVSTPYCIHCHL